MENKFADEPIVDEVALVTHRRKSDKYLLGLVIQKIRDLKTILTFKGCVFVKTDYVTAPTKGMVKIRTGLWFTPTPETQEIADKLIILHRNYKRLTQRIQTHSNHIVDLDYEKHFFE